uniref:Uncharacterized protein n=1 Tax=Tetranychus urticae TaxID=32264 RepID=T1JR10_TETUR
MFALFVLASAFGFICTIFVEPQKGSNLGFQLYIYLFREGQLNQSFQFLLLLRWPAS